MRAARIVLSWAVVIALAACDGPAPTTASDVPATGPVTAPNVTCSDTAFLVSWIEEPAENPRLRFARFDEAGFSAPRTVIENRPLLVNWADFPSLLSLGDGRLAAQWLERSAGASFAYGIRIATSTDGGTTWSEPFRPHVDDPKAEFGFVSLVDDGRGLVAVWLDGRGLDREGRGVMELRSRVWRGGEWSAETVLDGDVCSCCQTSGALAAQGVVVAYRDHTGPLRDIALVGVDGAEPLTPRPLHADGWEIAGCPVNGPALAAQGGTVAVAWYTEARGEPRVLLAFSHDDGRTFDEPVRVDDGAALGRVHLAMLDDGAAVVSWLEGPADGAAIVRARRFDTEGTPRHTWDVGRTRGARSSGFPRLAVCGSQIAVVWTDPGPPSRVRVSILPGTSS